MEMFLRILMNRKLTLQENAGLRCIYLVRGLVLMLVIKIGAIRKRKDRRSDMRELGRLVSKTAVYAIIKMTKDGLVLRNNDTDLEFDTYLSRAKMTPFTVMTDDEGLRAHVEGAEGIDVVSMKLEGLEGESEPIKNFPLSFSSMSTFDTCPRQFQHLYVLKDVKNEGSAATIWGTKCHKQIEDYIKVGTEITEPVAQNALPYLNSIKTQDAKVEWKWGLTKDLEPCGFSAPDVAYHDTVNYLALLDGGRAFVVEWEMDDTTDDFGKMDLFALATFIHYPDVQKIRGMYVWLKPNTHSKKDYTRADIEALKEQVQEKAKPVLHGVARGEFSTKPSGLCRGRCPVKECPEYKEV